MVTEGGNAGDGVNEYIEAGRVSDRNRLSGEDGTTDEAEDGEIPLPWNSIDETSAEEGEESGPETFEDLRFVGPKTASALESSEIELSDFTRKRISYRELTDAGVNPGVAAKIRREHSLSWSFDATDTDLSRRSTQVRGLDEEEREWIASSTGWGDEEAADGPNGRADDGEAASADRGRASGETDGRRPSDRRETAAGESAWRERAETEPSGTETPTEADDEEAWRSRTPDADRTDSATEDEEAAWRADSARGDDGGSNVTDGEAAWRSRSVESDDEAAASPERDEAAWRSNAGENRASTPAATDAEATWRAESVPTPVTVIDGVDEADAAELADAGIQSIRRLATADPESVADALQLDQTLVRGWVRAADERLDGV